MQMNSYERTRGCDKRALPTSDRVATFGTPGREAMLQQIHGIWWPQLSREIVPLARDCGDCEKERRNEY